MGRAFPGGGLAATLPSHDLSPRQNRAPRLPATVAVFDLDRTVTRAGTYTPFLLSCIPPGLGMAGRMSKALAGAVAYQLGLTTRGALKARMLEVSIAGATRDQVDAWSEAFVARWLQTHIRPGARAAIARHRSAGDRLVLATASFDFYARVFAARLGFDDVIATVSVWDENGRLRAALAGENCYGAVKLAAVQSYLAGRPSPARVVAYSDHHTDFALLRWAQEGVAVNPNAKLRRLAAAHGLATVDWDKT